MSAQANQRISTLILNTMLRLQPEDFYLASRVWSNRSSSEPMSARRFSSAMRDNSRSSEYFATRMEQLYNEGTYYNKYSIASIMMMLVILTSAEAAHEPLALCLSALCLQLPVPLHQTLLRPTRSPLPIHNKTQNTKHKTQPNYNASQRNKTSINEEMQQCMGYVGLHSPLRSLRRMRLFPAAYKTTHMSRLLPPILSWSVPSGTNEGFPVQECLHIEWDVKTALLS
jgi:hypothetical protein